VEHLSNNAFVFTRVSDAHQGQAALQIEISTLTDGARRLVTLQDLGQCSPAATTDHRYRISAWTKLKGLGSLVAYYRDSSGAFTYWAKSPTFSTSSDYQQVSWSPPRCPPRAWASASAPRSSPSAP
jgi:hypothetical protein